MTYTEAYTANLIASLKRTREELKTMIDTLVGSAEGEGPLDPMVMAATMHRMVGSICDDLEG